MEKPVIGIRQADGSFYQIMDESQAGKKRLVLSAARTTQRGVKIDLFRSPDGTLDFATPLGSLVLDDPEGLGYKDIEFQVDIDDSAQLDASAALPGQAPQRLAVDLSPYRGPRSDASVLADDSLGADVDTLDDSFLADPSPEGAEAMTLDFPEAEEDQPARPDSEILNDDQFDLADLDTLELDAPEAEAEPAAEPEAEALPDLDSLDDFDLAAMEPESAADSAEAEPEAEAVPDLDSLDDFDLAAMEPEPAAKAAEAEPAAEPEAETVPDLDSLGDFDLGTMEAEPAAAAEAEDFDLGDMEPLDDLGSAGERPADSGPLAAESFDLEDLDAGFGEAAPAAPGAGEEDWEKISLDDMDAMEFMDTGDEISGGTRPAAAPASAGSSAEPDEFSLDDDVPLELNDLDADLADLPDLDHLGQNQPESKEAEGADFDMDFLPPPALTETPAWEPAAPSKTKPAKKAKAPKPARGQTSRPAAPEETGPGGLDKTALFLSLAALSLLVLLILVLLFLNMIRPPATPVIQPEVMGWDHTQPMTPAPPVPSRVDLAAMPSATFEASTVLEVPEGLRHAQISLRLQPGETVDDAARRFGPPARVQGNQLSW